jgi:pilus assembly protein CpaF
MLQAMNTGHEGSLTTVHANSPRDALMRLETMVAMANFDIPASFVRRYVCSALHVIVHLERLTDGTRKLVSLQEITGMEGDTITLQEVFSFERMSIDPAGKVKGRFLFHGVRPRFVDKFAAMGITVPAGSFERTVIQEI